MNEHRGTGPHQEGQQINHLQMVLQLGGELPEARAWRAKLLPQLVNNKAIPVDFHVALDT